MAETNQQKSSPKKGGGKPARYKEIPFEVVVDVFQKNWGNVSATCRTLGIDRGTFNSWKDKFPDFEKMIEDAAEYCVDFAESKLLKAIQEDNLTAIIFYLKTKGKKRGYVEAVEQSVKVDAPVKLTMEQAKEFLKSIESEY